MSPADGPAVPALEVRGVAVRFGGVAALTDVSLTVRPGVVTGLIGPNGAGKTTLFNVITGLQRPDRGRVYLEGRDVTAMGPHRRARLGLARTFQRLELFGSLSASDNVRVGLEASRPRRRRGPRAGPDAGPDPAAAGPLADVPGSRPAAAAALLERVGVAGAAGAPVGSLPTGSARLVELARALAIAPRVLLLDEPCSGLDDHETAELGRLLVALAGEGRAVLLVEHDMDLVLEICDTVHVLDFGTVIASGPPDAIRADPAVQAAYLGRMDVPAGDPADPAAADPAPAAGGAPGGPQ